ncbi:hypothetical protein LPJ66_010770, partial [Kickxella alabastrina]
MDGRSNKDAAKFFNRIKNVEVLKSPYPRHLGQPSRGSGLTALSTRPIMTGNASSGAPPGSMRPISTHSAPTWHHPIPRHGENAVSPAGISRRINGGPVFDHKVSVSHRSPSNYPVSVQPIRTRPHSMPDQRFIPGSTLPAHVLAANTTQCHINSWSAYLDSTRGAISVHGKIMRADGRQAVRRSSAIIKVVDGRTLLTNKGTYYVLVGPADIEAMRLNGFPEHLIPYFAEGFPQNWRQLIEADFGRKSPGAHYEAPPASAPRTSINLKQGPTPLRRDESAEDYAGFESLPSSVLSDKTYAQQTVFSRSPAAANAEAKSHKASSVYSSGASLFSRGGFGRSAPQQNNQPSADKQAEFVLEESHSFEDGGIGRITECDEEQTSRAGTGCEDATVTADEAQNSPIPQSSCTTGLDSEDLHDSPELVARRPAPLESIEENDIEKLDKMFENASKRLVPARSKPAASSAKRNVPKRIVDSSDESSQPSLTLKPNLDSTSKKESSVFMDTPTKQSRRKAAPTTPTTRSSANRAPITPKASLPSGQACTPTSTPRKRPATKPASTRSKAAQESAASVVSAAESDDFPQDLPLDLNADSEPDKESGDKPADTPSSSTVTPKRRIGKPFFRYTEPKPFSTSVTRSGRKVRRPQDWWANAQGHLDESGISNHAEPSIKIKWGSGEAVVVKDGKRVRLSDYYLQGGDDKPL